MLDSGDEKQGSEVGTQLHDCPVKSGVVRGTGVAMGLLCPLCEGAAPRTQLHLRFLGSGHKGQGNGQSRSGALGLSWEDAVLTGELRLGNGQNQVPKGG